MKIKNNFLIAVSLAVLVLSSCTTHQDDQVRRSTLYNNESKVDTEGYTFFKLVHEKAQLETALAKYVQTTAAFPEAKSLAGTIIETYEPMVAELEELAKSFLVMLPGAGTPGFAVPHHFDTDTLGTFDGAGYIAHVQHEQAVILEQFNRISRNTSKQLKEYANEKMPSVKTAYAAAGGQEDHSVHH